MLCSRLEILSPGKRDSTRADWRDRAIFYRCSLYFSIGPAGDALSYVSSSTIHGMKSEQLPSHGGRPLHCGTRNSLKPESGDTASPYLLYAFQHL